MSAPAPARSAPPKAQPAPAPQQQKAAAAPQQKPAGFDADAWLNEQLDKPVEYKPFMGEDTIKLSARLVTRFLCRPTKSGKVCGLEHAMRFIMLCKARGLNPWEGDAYIVGYDTKDGPEFNLITAHQAFLKRAEVHTEYDGMRSGVIVREKLADGTSQVVELEGDFFEHGRQQVVGGWARVYFRTRRHEVYRRLNLAAYAKPFGVWQSNAAGMIVKCAEADALRSAFPNVLGGMYLEEHELRAVDGVPAPAPATRSEAIANRLRSPAPAPVNGHVEPAPSPDPLDTPAEIDSSTDPARESQHFTDEVQPQAQSPAPDALKPDTLKALKAVVKDQQLPDSGVLRILVDLGIRSDTDESPIDLAALSDADAVKVINEIESPSRG